MRLDRARAGEIPTELFFGSVEVEKAGVSVQYVEFDLASWPYVLGEKVDRWISKQFANHVAGRGLCGAGQFEKELPPADCIVAVDENAGLGISLLAMVGGLSAPVVCIKCRLSRAAPTSVFSHHLISRLTRAAHSVFIGRTEAETMPKRFKLAPKHFSFNPFGVDEQFWSPAPAPAEHIFAVGDSSRDYETLMSAAPHVKATFQVVSGLSVQQPLPANVIWQQGDWRKETLSDAEIRDFYRKAICVVIPLHERLEPSGQSVCLQAMACGKPVILTRSRGLQDPSLRDGENLLIVEPGDHVGLAAAINRLIADPALAERLGKAAREEVCRSFRIGQFAERLKETCAQLVASRAHRQNGA